MHLRLAVYRFSHREQRQFAVRAGSLEYDDRMGEFFFSLHLLAFSALYDRVCVVLSCPFLRQSE